MNRAWVKPELTRVTQDSLPIIAKCITITILDEASPIPAAILEAAAKAEEKVKMKTITGWGDPT